ncbi:MAG: hypothetical protein Q6364_08235 [Candidatus Hermodarchaeota archaeon]|nr:hypothetical protein [Candidatus Hermodarchaeota archaeon]
MDTETEDSSTDDDEEESQEPIDQLATILFVVFGGALGYLLIASGYGLYPFIVVEPVTSLLPTWDAVITFIALLLIMFLGLIGGLIRMRYSIVVVGVITVIAVFVVTFYAMLAISQLVVPLPP